MNRKIAVLADVHGNVSALDAVLKDAKAQQATDYWFLGDLLLPGPGSADLVAALTVLKPAVWLNGNWEQAFFDVISGHIDLKDPSDVYVARLAMYADRSLTSDELTLLKSHPVQTNIEVNGLRISAAHNLGQQTEGRMLYPAEPQANFDDMLTQAQDIAVYAHTHQQLMRTTTSGQLVINPGAVGQPYSPWPKFFSDQRAEYALLAIDDKGQVAVSFRKVAYDIQGEIDLAEKRQLPYLDLYRQLRETGETNTHNDDLLAQMNAKAGYEHEVASYFQVRPEK